MKSYRSLALLAVLLLTLGCSTHEGGPGGPGGPGGNGGPGGPGETAKPVTAEQRVADMTTRLNLTPEQSAAIKPIIEHQFERKQDIEKEGGSGSSSKKMRQEMDDLNWDTDKALSKILTEDQMLNYTKWFENADGKSDEGKPDAPGGGQGGRPGPPPR